MNRTHHYCNSRLKESNNKFKLKMNKPRKENKIQKKRGFDSTPLLEGKGSYGSLKKNSIGLVKEELEFRGVNPTQAKGIRALTKMLREHELNRSNTADQKHFLPQLKTAEEWNAVSLS